MRMFANRTPQIASAAVAIALLAGCASGTETARAPLTQKQAKILEKSLAGRVPGEPVNCIPLERSTNTVRVNDDIILYEAGRTTYKNELRGSCPGLARDSDFLVVEVFGSQQCRGDLIKLVDRTSHIPGATCVLGDFIPYRKAAKAS